MIFLNRLKLKLAKIEKLESKVNSIQDQLHKIQESIGRIEKRQVATSGSHNIINNEFRVFSQWGEDGIIQMLVDRLEIKQKIFVEFGVQNYTEANTRFLLINNNWSGLVIDPSEENIKYIKNDPIYWQYNLKAIPAFITVKNINDLLIENGVQGDIGLLSIDIDGNDYWVWEAIDVVNPAIVVIEYNFRFGKNKAVTIPYQQDFARSSAHFSNLYFGASLKALAFLAYKKGYAFVGSNSAGNNAFFVRKDIKPNSITELSVEEGYIAGQFRESRNEEGHLVFLTSEQEQEILESLPLVEISSPSNLHKSCQG